MTHDNGATDNLEGECWDCKHPIAQHSREYPGWDRRTHSFDPVKREGTGCLVGGCECRRWFEKESTRMGRPTTE